MSPSRSTQVTLVNRLSRDLVLTGKGLSHGIWTQGQHPKDVIKAGSSGSFQAESAGFMTGDEGWVTYSVTDAGTFQFNFNNPYTGSNGYSDEKPNGYIAQRSGGSGDNAEVTWVIEKAN